MRDNKKSFCIEYYRETPPEIVEDLKGLPFIEVIPANDIGKRIKQLLDESNIFLKIINNGTNKRN